MHAAISRCVEFVMENFNRILPGNKTPMFPENTRFNYLNELREQFTKFENEVWNYNSLRPNEAFKIDLKLPLLLIETFAKVFRLWRDFDAFQNLIKPELFHQINADMNEYFGMDLGQFDLYCDTCDKNIAVEKNNLKRAYELHSQDKDHQAVLNDLNYLVCPTPTPSTKYKPSDAGSIEAASKETRDDFNGYIIFGDDGCLKCTLCELRLSDEQEAIHHVTYWSHRLKEMHFSPDDKNYIVGIDGTYCCRLCRCKLPKNKESHANHLSCESHQLMEQCSQVLKENGTTITVLNNDKGAFVCNLCDKKGPHWHALLKHSLSDEHKKSVCFSRNTSQLISDSNDFILFSNNRYECLLCQRILDRHEIAGHKQDDEHVQKLFIVLNDHEPLSSPSVLDSSSESEGYNDAFKNNDIYIEINLKEDDSEVFKCVLCNKSGRGLVNLDAHCLTPIHLEHKKHIEKISKAYADCDVREEPANVITDIEDLYYCQVCDVLIEDEASISDHVKEKTHIQSEELRKVLNENRDCVSLLADEPTRFYHCQLCSRSIDGDSNIVGHCNSGRHTQLLNMVKTLSRNRSMRTI